VGEPAQVRVQWWALALSVFDLVLPQCQSVNNTTPEPTKYVLQQISAYNYF